MANIEKVTRIKDKPFNFQRGYPEKDNLFVRILKISYQITVIFKRQLSYKSLAKRWLSCEILTGVYIITVTFRILRDNRPRQDCCKFLQGNRN